MYTINSTLRTPDRKALGRCDGKNYRRILREGGYFDKYIAKTIQNNYSKGTNPYAPTAQSRHINN